MKWTIIDESTKLLTTYRGDGTYILRTFPDLFRDGFEHVVVHVDPETRVHLAVHAFAAFTPFSALQSIEQAHAAFVAEFDRQMTERMP